MVNNKRFEQEINIDPLYWPAIENKNTKQVDDLTEEINELLGYIPNYIVHIPNLHTIQQNYEAYLKSRGKAHRCSGNILNNQNYINTIL